MQSRMTIRWLQRHTRVSSSGSGIAAALHDTPTAWRSVAARISHPTVSATQHQRALQQLMHAARTFSTRADKPTTTPASSAAAASSSAAATPKGGANAAAGASTGSATPVASAAAGPSGVPSLLSRREQQRDREDRAREERWSRHQQSIPQVDAAARHSWHRALTAHERRALVAIIAANVWVMFMSMYAEDSAKAAGPDAPPSDLEDFLHRHLEASTYNAFSGRLYTLATATLRHGDLPHLAVNMAVLMMVGPGVLATVGLRSFAKIYAGAAVAAWSTELAFWDGLVPLLKGQPVHPGPDGMHKMINEIRAAHDKGVELPKNQM